MFLESTIARIWIGQDDFCLVCHYGYHSSGKSNLLTGSDCARGATDVVGTDSLLKPGDSPRR